MNLNEIVAWARDHFEAEKNAAETFAAQHLPALAKLADQAAANPVIDAVMESQHLDPEWFASLADVIRKADSALGVAVQARADAEARAIAAEQPDAGPAAESAA